MNRLEGELVGRLWLDGHLEGRKYLKFENSDDWHRYLLLLNEIGLQEDSLV